MTLAELINLGKHKVRNDESLMLFYIEQFQQKFGRKPDCAGCTFKRDWEKLRSSLTRINKKMTTKNNSFELKHNEKQVIHTYKDGKRPVRTYGYKMDESFAEAYLTKGNKKEIEERKNAFKTLPLGMREKQDVKIEIEGKEVLLSKATGAQLDAFAENKIEFENGALVKDKRKQVEAYLNS